MTAIVIEEVAPDFEGCPSEPTPAELEMFIADPVRAALAELGGREIRQALWDLMPEIDPSLSYAYGRMRRFVDEDSTSRMWFQPADGSRARRLVIPTPTREALELVWEASDCGPRQRVIITAEIPEGCDVQGRYDAMLVAIALSAPEDFGADVTVVTSGVPYGFPTSWWPERFVLPGPVVQL
ncbi:MAG: hypothetical protein M0Z95_28770 [Actinomycetota bacterium]|jgi:hypothetical protein|nr:hypothetical protein [Actinomycetota bacterium]